ncbi:hypothetical protein LIER_31341 [Lithospermum erythrorhizon]|uniref:Gag-pol polyprotein n=1 Tax=Lithospermum erythrorhizon TaxID=34254 RepID=A0AAV3RRN6_LITER
MTNEAFVLGEPMSNEKQVGRKQAKGYYATHSDDDTDGENEDVEDIVSNFVSFTAAISKKDSDTPTVTHSACHDSEDEGEITEEELMANYQMLFDKWSKLTEAYTLKEDERQKLEQANLVLLNIVEEHKSKIGVLEGKVESMTKGIKMINSNTNIFDEILEKGNRERDASGIGYFNSRRQQDVSHQKYMTGDQSNLSDIKKLSGDFVTFRGGAKEKITRKGIIRVDGLPSLKDVLLVDGLTVNLINIKVNYVMRRSR